MRTILLLLGLHVLFAFGYWLLITINKIEIFRANQLREKKFSIAHEIHTGLSVFESIYGTKEIANVFTQIFNGKFILGCTDESDLHTYYRSFDSN